MKQDGSAARRGAPETAAELFEQAARLTPVEEVETRSSRWISAADMHRTSGDIAHAWILLEEFLPEVPSGSTRARALLELSLSTRTNEVAPVDTLDGPLGEADGDHHMRALIELE